MEDVLIASPEQKDTKGAIEEEERDAQPDHVSGPEQVKRQERLLGDPALDIDEHAEQHTTEDEGDDDIGRGPALGRVGAVRDGIGDEGQGRDDGGGAQPVHLDALGLGLGLGLGVVAGDGEEGDAGGDEEDDAADVKVPLPRQLLGRDAADEDAHVEAQRGRTTVDAEDEVLAGAGAVRLGDESDGGGDEGGGADAGEGAGRDEHVVVGREARDQTPDGEPQQAAAEDGVGAVDVGEAAKRQQQGTGDERVD